MLYMTYMESIRIQNKNKIVFTIISVSLTLLLLLNSSINSVFANEQIEFNKFVQYGELNLFHEDKSIVEFNQEKFVNVVMKQGDGKFVSIDDYTDLINSMIQVDINNYCEFGERDNCDTIPQNIKIPIEHLNLVSSE